MYKEIHGDLIALAKQGHFDVIAHGCNCFCTMGAGIAPQMAKAFGCDEFSLEQISYTDYTEDGLDYQVKTHNKGDINKLGQIDYRSMGINTETGRVLFGFTLPKPDFIKEVTVVNAYTQFHYGHKYGTPFDYEAFTLCMRKMNHIFKGKHIGLPQIGAGLAGGVWELGKGGTDISPFKNIGEWMDFKSSGKFPIKTIIKEELKDCEVTIVIYKP